MSGEKRDKRWEYLHLDSEEGSFYEDDGSWGIQNADGSSSYYGNDCAWGYKNYDGSGAYYGGTNGEDCYYDADDDESSSGSGDLSDILAGAIGAAIGIGAIKYSQKRE